MINSIRNLETLQNLKSWHRHYKYENVGTKKVRIYIYVYIIIRILLLLNKIKFKEQNENQWIVFWNWFYSANARMGPTYLNVIMYRTQLTSWSQFWNNDWKPSRATLADRMIACLVVQMLTLFNQFVCACEVSEVGRVYIFGTKPFCCYSTEPHQIYTCPMPHLPRAPPCFKVKKYHCHTLITNLKSS